MPRQSKWQSFVHDHAGKGLTIQQLSKMYQSGKKDTSVNNNGIALNLVQERDALRQRLASLETDRAILSDQLQLCQDYMLKSKTRSKSAYSSKKRNTSSYFA